MVIYEYHDIAVSNFSQAAVALQKFSKNIRWNLMVIPFSGELAGEALNKFALQLAQWKKEGHSLHLHGYMHKANLSLKRSLFGKLALRLTDCEAEFAGLSKDDSSVLLEDALEAWQKLNLGEAQGFAAPAWYGSKTLFSLCKNFGFKNYSSRFVIWNREKGSKLSIPFSAAGLPKFCIPILNISKKIYLKIYGIFSFLPTPRIVMHPSDIC
jgi:predicted deacetylase